YDVFTWLACRRVLFRSARVVVAVGEELVGLPRLVDLVAGGHGLDGLRVTRSGELEDHGHDQRDHRDDERADEDRDEGGASVRASPAFAAAGSPTPPSVVLGGGGRGFPASARGAGHGRLGS